MCYPSFLTYFHLSAWSSLFQYKSVAIMPETRLDNAGLLMNLKKILLKICIYATIICVLVSVFAAPAFATGDVVQFTEAAKLGASIVDLYGFANNTNLAYDVASNQSALTVIENLYTEYSSNASDPYTLAAIGAAAAAAGAIAVIYDAVTGQGYIQLYQEQYISSLDGYWDYQLTDIGFVRDSLTGLFSWTETNGVVSPIALSSSNFLDLNGNLVPTVPITYHTQSNSTKSITSTGTAYTCLVYNSDWQDYYYFVFVPNGGSFSVDGGSAYYPNNSYGEWKYSVNQLGYADWSYNYPYEVYTHSGVPTPTNTFGSYSTSSVNSQSVSVEPSNFVGDPLQNPLEITYPNPSSPDYVPAPRRITTTIPWDPTWGDPLPDGVSEPEYGVPYPITDPALLNTVVPEIWDDIVANDVQIQPDPTPSDPDSPIEEVIVPFLPLEIPSFNFSLSGIWHYVVTWVQSLGSWFTALFAMWSCLPYAMVVPVYATLVVVIVLGLYKRFIA